MRSLGLEFNHHRWSERLCCLKFGYVAVCEARMDGLSGGWLMLLIKEGARRVLGAGGEGEAQGFNQDLCSFT